MNYIDTQTGAYPLTEYQIKQANSQTSFPSPFSSDRYKPVVVMPQPAFDPVAQSIAEGVPVNYGTHWEQTWEVVELDEDTILTNMERAEEQRKAGILQQIAAIEAKQARAVREAALGDTTYLQQIENQIVALRAQL